MREPDERDLRVLLREEAERHRPDRDAMFERIVRGRAESRRATLVRLRPLAAAAAVGAVVVGVVGVRVAGGGGEGDSAPAPAAAPSAVLVTPSPTRPATSAPPRVSASSKAAHRPVFLTADGEVDSHSNPNWTQGNVTLRTTRKLTALEVTVSVSRTDRVANTGQWSTLSNEMITMSVAERDGRLVYRFVLKDGASVSPGRYIFAVQFNHASKRSPAADTFAVSATGGGRDASAAGGF